MKYELHLMGSENGAFGGHRLLLLNGHEVEVLLSMSEALQVVEHAFRLQAMEKVLMPPKLYLDLPQYQGDFRAMPAYIDGSAGVKWVSVYPNNWRQNLPSVMATIILCDANTGCPLAVMDGTYITKIRTGAAGGVAVKYLARRDSSVIGLIGAGVQARTQLLAISEVLPKIEQVKVFDQQEDVSAKYVDQMRAKLGLSMRPVKTIQEATEADIVITTTPSKEPVVKKQHIAPGTHINAIGADAKGKQELEANLLRSAKIVVDDIEQASHSGEINVSLSQGLIRLEDIYATLGEVVVGMKKGRENDKEITIFDSTGLATQDIVCAKLIYEKVKEKGVPTFELL
jgi:alanine dehydrogenase